MLTCGVLLTTVLAAGPETPEVVALRILRLSHRGVTWNLPRRIGGDVSGDGVREVVVSGSTSGGLALAVIRGPGP